MFEIFAVLVTLVLIYFYWSCTYWARKGVKAPRPLPIVGNMFDYFFARKHYGEVYQDIYNSFPKAAYVGIYRLLNEPAIVVRDLGVVKDVLIKDFQSFRDTYFLVDKKMDPLAIHNPFIATGDHWKNVRAQMGQLFTPNKIKTVFPIIFDTCLKLSKYVDVNKNQGSLEVKSLCAKYTIEIMASAGFGLEAQTFTNPESDFALNCENIFTPQSWSYIHNLGANFSSSIAKFFNVPYIPQRMQEWLLNIIKGALETRKNEEQTRNDFLQVLLNTKDSSGNPISEEVIYGHCVTLLLEGFETSSTTMEYCLYELAQNPDALQKVRDEVDRIFEKYEGKLTYEAVSEMTYLDCAIYETLRMFPPMLATIKKCTETTTFPPQYPGSKSISIPAESIIVIPTLGIHYDPEIYPDPHIFNPDRFSEEAQKARSKCSFLAFGEGPRICIGMRFGMAQSKAGIATLVRDYNMRVSPKTKTPLEMSPTTFLINAKGGIWIEFEKRNKSS